MMDVEYVTGVLFGRMIQQHLYLYYNYLLNVNQSYLEFYMFTFLSEFVEIVFDTSILFIDLKDSSENSRVHPFIGILSVHIDWAETTWHTPNMTMDPRDKDRILFIGFIHNPFFSTQIPIVYG